MANRMKTVQMPKEESMTIVIGPITPRLRFVGAGRKTRFDDKRRKPRTTQKRGWQKGQ